MKLAEGDFVKIVGGQPKELHGVHGKIMSTAKKTVWIQLLEGSRKTEVVTKRNMKWVTKVPKEQEANILGKNYNHNSEGNGNNKTLFIAMHKNDSKTNSEIRDGIKEVFAQMGYQASSILILPTSRNALVYFEEDDITKLLDKKSVTIDKYNCRVGKYYGKTANNNNSNTNNSENTAPKFTQKRSNNSRADAFKEAISSTKRRRHFY